MAFLDRVTVKKIVSESLRKVADFNGDIEGYSFQHFQEFHKAVFLNELRKRIIEHPFMHHDGTSSMDQYYDVPLSLQVINTWPSLTACIDYTMGNQAVRPRPTKLTL
jgi:hypothetical protein